MERIEDLDEIGQMGFYSSVLNSIYQFDMVEVRPVVGGLLSPDLLEECRSLLYIRYNNNVGSLLDLKHVPRFQALGMLARALYELTADINCWISNHGAAIKMWAYLDIEKSKHAGRPSLFPSSKAQLPAPFQEAYIRNNETRIEVLAAQLWPKQE